MNKQQVGIAYKKVKNIKILRKAILEPSILPKVSKI